MTSSYLLLDENLCFLNKGLGKPTRSILEISITEALKNVYWDKEGFQKRGKVYKWFKSNASERPTHPELEW